MNFKIIIIRIKCSFNQSINDQKHAFGHFMNNDDYLRRKNIRLTIDQQSKLSESKTSEIKLKGYFA